MPNKKNSVKAKKVAGAPARNRHFELAPILAPSLDSTMETYEAYLLCYRLYRESVEQFRKQQVEGKSKGAEASQAHRGNPIITSSSAADKASPETPRAQPQQGSKSTQRKLKRAARNLKRKERKARRSAAKQEAEKAEPRKVEVATPKPSQGHKSPSALLRQQARAAFRALPPARKAGANSKKVYKALLRKTYVEGRKSGVITGAQKESAAEFKARKVRESEASATKASGAQRPATQQTSTSTAQVASGSTTANKPKSKAGLTQERETGVPSFLEHGKTTQEYVRARVLCDAGGQHEFSPPTVAYKRGLEYGYGKKCRKCSNREYVLSARGQLDLGRSD